MRLRDRVGMDMVPVLNISDKQGLQVQLRLRLGGEQSGSNLSFISELQLPRRLPAWLSDVSIELCL